MQTSNKKSAVPFWMFWAIITVFLFWRCHIGFANMDEPFYITIPWRLTKGAALFRDEWHLSQMSSFLLYPVMKIYLFFTAGNTERILLNFRYIYTAVQCAVAVFLYYRLKKYSNVGAIIGSIAFEIFAPNGIPALSYNSMAVINLVISCVIVCSAERRLNLQYIIAGVFFAAAVLCCPYLIIAWLLFLILIIINFFTANKACPVNCKFFAYFTSGAFILAVTFFSFVLSRCSVSDIIDAIPGMLSDPEHTGALSLFAHRISWFFTSLLSLRIKYLIAFVLLVLAAVCLIVILKSKKRFSYKTEYIILVSLLSFAVMLFVSITMPGISYTMLSINFAALCMMIVNEDKTNTHIFNYVCLPGWIFGVLMYFASNQGFNSFCFPLAVALPGSIIVVIRSAKAAFPLNKKRETVLSFCIVLLISSFLGTELFYRYSQIYFDNTKAWEQNMKIDKGPEGGLLVNENLHNSYYNKLHDVDLINHEGKTVLYICGNRTTYMYFMSNMDVASYSTWLSGTDKSIFSRLDMYYSLNHEMPDIVYIIDEFKETAEDFSSYYNYATEKMDFGYKLTPNQ